MKVTLESTDRIVTVNGVPARVWQGQTDSGIICYAMITRIAVRADLDSSQFDRELQACAPLRSEFGDAIPSTVVL